MKEIRENIKLILNQLDYDKIDCKIFKSKINLLKKCLRNLKNKLNKLDAPSKYYESTNFKKEIIKKFRDKYYICDEVPFKNSRFDIFAVEKSGNNVIGFEIKTSANDLKQDKKFEKYLEFCNKLYFVVPENLKDKALEKINKSSFKKNIGLYIINNNELKLIKRAFSNKKDFNKEKLKNVIFENGYNKYVYKI
jgi:hypothetical protein